MDFEEQLEKAEKLTTPSLVGSSLRSADDSAHQNYIHPEKYTGKKLVAGKHSILNSSIGASLDDLISEGALLGSEEDFERFLDDKGNVKSNAKYLAKNSGSDEPSSAAKVLSPLKTLIPQADDAVQSPDLVSPVVSPVVSQNSTNEADLDERPAPGSSIYGSDHYSTPNLSEYQLDQQISDHSELLDLVKSYDLNKLPSSIHRERSKTNEPHAASERVPRGVKVGGPRKNSTFAAVKSDDARVVDSDSLHTPYFPRDERSPSRSRVAHLDAAGARARSRSASRSRLANKPHLARGDSYKSTHEDSPTKYELPANLSVEEEEDAGNDRRSRQSKPTMGDSIAAAEHSERLNFHSEVITRDPSLVTTGDYTNFNCDAPSQGVHDLNLFSVRSQSSTNYLRSISRSRSRQPQTRQARDASVVSEKNDANPEELAKEGALVSDDPYDQLSGLDDMVDKVLKKPAEATKESKKLVNDVSAEKKDTETKEQLLAEGAPALSAKDIKVDAEEALEATKSSEYVEDIKEEETENEDDSAAKLEADEKDVPAEVKVKEAKEQLIAEEAPLLTAKDVNMKAVKQSEAPTAKLVKDEVTKSEAPKLEETAVPVADETEQDESKEELETPEAAEDKPELETPEDADDKLELETPEETEDKLDSESGAETPEETEEKADTETETPNDKLEVASDQAKALTEDTVSEKDSSSSGGLLASASALVSAGKKLVESAVEDVEELVKDKLSPEETEAADEKDIGKSEENDDTKPLTKELTLDAPAKELKLDAATKEVEVEADKKAAAAAVTTSTPIAEDTTKTKAAEPETAAVEDESFDISPEELKKHLQSLPIYLFTSLAGGMQIIQKTNRLATILQGNGIKFEYRDLGTDEDAKKLWRRYAQGKTLPGVVRGDDFIGNWQYIEEVNEDYRLQEVLYETL